MGARAPRAWQESRVKLIAWKRGQVQRSLAYEIWSKESCDSCLGLQLLDMCLSTVLNDSDKVLKHNCKVSHCAFSDWFWDGPMLMRELEPWTFIKIGPELKFSWEPGCISEKWDFFGNQNQILLYWGKRDGRRVVPESKVYAFAPGRIQEIAMQLIKGHRNEFLDRL